MNLVIVCPSMGGHEEAVKTWEENMSETRHVVIDAIDSGEQAGFLSKCDRLWRENECDVMGYLHSDLFIHGKDWDKRVLAEFEDPKVAVVGFLGATDLGHGDIYKIPYHLTQLARGGVWSNMTDAEVHGGRETGSLQVAVIDSCAVFVRRYFLARCSGWPVGGYPNSSHCSDLWISCMANRMGMAVRMVGVSSTHRSGGKGDVGSKWLEAHGTDIAMHRQAHELIYKDFRDVLPIRIR